MAKAPTKEISVLAVIGMIGYFIFQWFISQRDLPPAPTQPGEGYLFCFWNVENLFDDRNDNLTGPGDKKYDPEFANDPQLLSTKLDHLCDVLMQMNGGRGPDILALAEIESQRATDLLRIRLNNRMKSDADHYKYLAFKESGGGRHISTPVISRVPIAEHKTIKNRYRILSVKLKGNDHDLYVIASHWSSRLSDKTGATRGKYAKAIYGRFNTLYQQDPNVDLLVCGDFNDNPDDASVVTHLRGKADREDALKVVDGQPNMFNPFAKMQGEKDTGTLYYRGWNLYDQIVVSPGLLDDKGWTCLPETAAIANLKVMQNRNGKPRSFSAKTQKNGYGYSDHFPVTIRIKLQE